MRRLILDVSEVGQDESRRERRCGGHNYGESVMFANTYVNRYGSNCVQRTVNRFKLQVNSNVILGSFVDVSFVVNR